MDQLTQFLMQIFKPVVELISHHPLAVLLFGFAWWIFSGVTSSLPTPTDKDSRAYTFAYNLAHWLSGSVGRLYEWLRFGKSFATTEHPQPPKE